MTPRSHLIIPFVNRSAVLFRGPAWYLADHVRVERIRGEDFAILSKEADQQHAEAVRNSPRAVYVSNIPPNATVHDTAPLCSSLQFLFNTFRENYPAIMSTGFLIAGKRAFHLARTHEYALSGERDSFRKLTYRLRPGTDRSTLSSHFKVILEAQRKNPHTTLAINRFNSALCRSNIFDSVVDLTIALESLIEADTEIRYRFAVCNAICSTPAAEDRHESYNLLKYLYGARSKIVHGTRTDATKQARFAKELDKTWPRLADLASKAIYLATQFNWNRWAGFPERPAGRYAASLCII